MKEKYYGTSNISKVNIKEGKIVSFEKVEKEQHSFRFHKDGFVGIQEDDKK